MTVPTLWPPGHRYGGSLMLKGEREAWELGYKAGQEEAAVAIANALLPLPNTHPYKPHNDASDPNLLLIGLCQVCSQRQVAHQCS